MNVRTVPRNSFSNKSAFLTQSNNTIPTPHGEFTYGSFYVHVGRTAGGGRVASSLLQANGRHTRNARVVALPLGGLWSARLTNDRVDVIVSAVVGLQRDSVGMRRWWRGVLVRHPCSSYC